MSKIKTKITKWEYVTEPFDVLVLPALVKRVHAPLQPSFTAHYSERGLYLHLRPCVQGVDEYGAVVKYLYCTRDGRFFTRRKDGWIEIKPDCYGNNPKKKGGSSDCPQLRWYGWKPCHRCVAVAWCNPPEYVKATINDKDAKRIHEVDHKNTDHKNWTADNLQWVTADENRRRAKIARQLRKAAIDPKLLTPTLCGGIYTLPEGSIPLFVEQYLKICANDKSQMLVENIRINVAMALDAIKSTIKDN